VSHVIQAGEFFVVGGPVQPDRLCYVERTADQVLETSIRAQQFCFVLGPRAIGKSSLMGRTVRMLRRADELAAAIDLAQLAARGDSADAERWSYGIVHRIVRDLRLKVDLARWWEGKAVRGAQRLADFFWEIVLTHTTSPVTVFFDEIEHAAELPYAAELFAAIHACQARRAAERDCARLNFVMLGVATPQSLCADERISPFAGGRQIELEDFDAAQSYQLAPGLGGGPALAQALLDRICSWTNGHPYLTQKVARGVARKGGKLEDVERVVKEQLLSPAGLVDDALVAHMHAALSARTPAGRRARALLARVASRANVPPPAGGAELDTLRLAGVVRIDGGGHLRYRNRVFQDVFGRRWLKTQRPAGRRVAAAIAALLATAAIGAFWYQEYLPRPYLRTLTDETADLAAAEAAYSRLVDLPGFAERAAELFTATLVRHSERASDLAAISASDRALRTALGRQELADELMADFWLRQAAAAMHEERRDDALLLAREALPAQAARSLLAQLIGADYPHLARTLDWPRRPPSFVVDWQERRLVGLDAERTVQSLALRGPATAMAAPFSVLEYRPLERELQVADEGSAGVFTLALALEHAAADDLLLTLTAPSGARATVPLEANAAEHALVAEAGSPLAVLADEDREGTWRLAIVDRRIADSGRLLDWTLAFGADGEPWRATPDGAADIPDPVRSTDVTVQLSTNGRIAIVRPARQGTSGALALWSLRDGALLRDLQLPAPAASVQLNADGTRLVAVAGNTLHVWNVDEDAATTRVATQTEFVLPPALSPDGEYLMIAERVDGAPPLFSLLRAADGALLTSVEGADGVRDWLLGAQARYLALVGDSGGLGVVDPRRGGAPRALVHSRAIARIDALGMAGLLTVDAAGDVRAWRFGGASGAEPVVLGTTVDPRSVSAALDGSQVAFAAQRAVVAVFDAASGAKLHTLRVAPGVATLTQIAPDGGALVTVAGSTVRLWELGDASPSAAAPPLPELTAIALDAGGETAALGFRAGHVRVVAAASLDDAPLAAEGLDYFGHRGAVASIAVHGAGSVLASGGRSDGVVRLWDAATAEPERALTHSGGAVSAVALSHDGAALASATASSVRVWRTSDGELLVELASDPPAAALAFSADGRALAIGDAAGGVRLVDAASGAPRGGRIAFGEPLRWLQLDAGGRLFAATDHWLHEVTIAAERPSVVRSALLPLDAQPAALAANGAVLAVRGLGTRALAVVGLAFDGSAAPLEPDAAALAKDWPDVLGRRLAPDGTIAPITR
jgi:WD40 repeat protein